MELGEKLLRARQEAGLSQRQLCGDVITRNMLSQIEHGTARPSMSTLQYLAGRLEKPVSYFLEEHMEVSPNQQLMSHARRAWAEGKWEEARGVLEGYIHPDDMFGLEYRYLTALTTLEAAKKAIEGKKLLYAMALLTDMESVTAELPGLERRRVLMLGSIADRYLPELCRKLPGLDEELFLRARAALEQRQYERGIALLNAMEHRDCPDWYLLAGRLRLGSRAYDEAKALLQKAEAEYPRETAPLLEQCFRELGDYRQAYFYACRQKR